MRRLGLLEERCLWPAPHVARRVRGGLETRPHFLFCSGCVWRKGLQVQGWCGSNGKHFFSFLLTLSILSPFFTWSLHILWLCPNARLAPSLDASYPPRSSSSVYWFRPPLLCLGSCTSSVSRPACPSISVCLPRTRGGRTRLLSL